MTVLGKNIYNDKQQQSRGEASNNVAIRVNAFTSYKYILYMVKSIFKSPFEKEEQEIPLVRWRGERSAGHLWHLNPPPFLATESISSFFQ